MDKTSFIKEYNIRDAMPIDPASRVLPAEGMAYAIGDFINERFRGVAHAGVSVASYSGVLLCPEYMAYFFKTLFTYLYGRCFAEVEITNDNERLSILIRTEEDLPLCDREIRDLIRIARNARSEITVGSREITVALKFGDAARRHVYAISVNDGRRIMLAKLGEIFYSGEYLSADVTDSRPLPKPTRRVGNKK